MTPADTDNTIVHGGTTRHTVRATETLRPDTAQLPDRVACTSTHGCSDTSADKLPPSGVACSPVLLHKTNVDHQGIKDDRAKHESAVVAAGHTLVEQDRARRLNEHLPDEERGSSIVGHSLDTARGIFQQSKHKRQTREEGEQGEERERMESPEIATVGVAGRIGNDPAPRILLAREKEAARRREEREDAQKAQEQDDLRLASSFRATKVGLKYGEERFPSSSQIHRNRHWLVSLKLYGSPRVMTRIRWVRLWRL